MTPQNRTGLMLLGVVVTMTSLSFAVVPFYSWFCQVTGYGGTTAVAVQSSDQIIDQWVTVHFDANTDPAMPWSFKPQQAEMKLRIGENALAFYEAYNPTDRVIAGQAAYNVAPDLAGGYFTKVECFCFTEQVLQPHERIVMPVSFFVDPAMVDDPDAKDIAEITLSYTFYEIPLPDQQAALSVPLEVPAKPAIN